MAAFAAWLVTRLLPKNNNNNEKMVWNLSLSKYLDGSSAGGAFTLTSLRFAPASAQNTRYVCMYRGNILLLRTCATCLRSSSTAPRPSLESHFLILLSSFSFCRRSAHSCLHDLSIIPTNFWRGSLLPLTVPPTFLLRSFCLRVASYFLHSTTACLRNCEQNTVSFLRSLNPQLRHRRHQTHCRFYNVSPWSCHSCYLSLLLLHSIFEPVTVITRCTCFFVTSIMLRSPCLFVSLIQHEDLTFWHH